VGDAIVLSGSSRSVMLVGAGEGRDLCLTVALLDGLVLARSAFHHSVNYRSVVIFGRARPISDPQRRRGARRALTERFYRGRWALVRPPSEQELAATAVLELPLEEVSAKVRGGGTVYKRGGCAIPLG